MPVKQRLLAVPPGRLVSAPRRRDRDDRQHGNLDDLNQRLQRALRFSCSSSLSLREPRRSFLLALPLPSDRLRNPGSTVEVAVEEPNLTSGAQCRLASLKIAWLASATVDPATTPADHGGSEKDGED
jgi:hypothetical protein